MNKISELNLKKLLLTVSTNDSKTSGKTPINIIGGWNKKSLEELNDINERRQQDNNNNQYYIMLNREYIVIDTDEERSYIILVKYLKENNLYFDEAITKSYRGRTKNIYYKRHFWFKVNNQKQFKHIKEEAQIDFIGGEIFFGNSAFIGEWKETIINNVPEIDISIYNDIYELLTTSEPEIKSKEIEKVYIDTSDDEEEPNKKVNKETNIKKPSINSKVKQINNKNNNNNDEISLILDGLNEKRYLKYDYWLKTYFICLNDNIDLKYFEDFSSKHPNYNKYENDKILKNIEPKKGYTIATLYFWLKEDNPELFKELCKNRNDFWKLQINNVSIADFYFQINPDSYIYTYNSGWYEYNHNNVLIHRGEVPINLSNGFGRKLQEIATEQRNFITPEHPKYKEYMDFYNKFYKNVSSTSFINSTIEQLKLPYYKDIDSKINNINLFAFNNAVYDFTTNTYRLINKDDYIIKTTGYDLKYKVINNKIVPTVDNKIKEELKQFIYSLFESDELVDYWLNITAQSLFGNDTEQKFYIFSGKGSNGKSLTQKLICSALGQYYKSVSNNFLAGSIKKGGADPELASCVGTRYLSVSEPDDTEGKKFNVSNLKNWSGGDKIQARELYGKKMIEFYAQFTLFINCNDLPELSSTDDGVKRRVRNIHFPFQFKDEKELKNNKNYRLININLGSKLTNPEYIQNFILMLFEYATLNKNKIIPTPKTILDNSNKYCDENNVLYNWFESTIIKTDDSKDLLNATVLLNDYHNSEYLTKKLRPVDFSKLMEKLGVEKIIKNKISYYTNVKFVLVDEE